MTFRFEVDESKWNLVSEKGLPQEDEWFLLVVEESDGEYDYFMGSYCKEDDVFYVDFGLGGLSTEAENVIAWDPILEGNDNYLKVTK